MSDQVPFDVSVTYDEQGHEVASRPAEMRRAIGWLSERLAGLDRRQRARVCGLCGVYARILRDFDAAHAFLHQALDLAAQLGDERLLFNNRIRLAHVYQWQAQYARSNELFENLLATSHDQPLLASLLDFLYQHAGKNAFDQQQYDRAEHYLREALRLRRVKGDLALIESTEHALALVQQRKQHTG
ncbi:MAG TPA: hypothetical protein VGD69_13570 [Herpetosiphonaceae bacterium]